MGDRICKMDGCGKPLHAVKRGWCLSHYNRWRKFGDANYRPCCKTCGNQFLEERPRGGSAPLYCSDTCKPRCSVRGCESPYRKSISGGAQVCASHYSQWRRTGVVKPFAYKWSTEYVCVVCGKQVQPGSRRRSHCSAACQVMSSRWGSITRPKFLLCVRCGTKIDLLAVGKAGRRKRADALLCRMCKQQSRFSMSATELAARDGTDCRICGTVVDMSAAPKAYLAPSVDHIIPRSLGGSDDPENLQLAHLWCNQVKQKRTGFTLLAPPPIQQMSP